MGDNMSVVTDRELINDIESAVDCLKAAAKALRDGLRAVVPAWILTAEGFVGNVHAELVARDTGWSAG